MLIDVGFLLTPESKQKDLHYTELPELELDHPLRTAWNTYRREVPRFLAEGREGQHVVIHEDEVFGFWASHDTASSAGRSHYGLKYILVHRIVTNESLLRVGWLWRPRVLPSQSPPRA